MKNLASAITRSRWPHFRLRKVAGKVSLFALLLLVVPGQARAGLYYSGEQYAELPSRMRGFLIDHRALRSTGVERPGDFASPLRDDYLAAAQNLEKLAKSRPLTSDEAADLGAIYLRLGKPDPALGVLLPASRKNPDHFRLAANLGTAFQISGDLERAADYLSEAVRLAPDKLKKFEQYHLKLVRLRLKEGKGAATAVDDLFGVKYAGDPGKFSEDERKKLPEDAVAILQQLALWLPSDGRLLWQLGELANVHGDVRSAAAMLEGCVTEFAMGAPDLRKRRQLFRAAVDEMAKNSELDQHKLGFQGKSARPLIKAFDESMLPQIQANVATPLPWPVLAATTIDARGRAVFLKYLEKLDGKTVTMTGFMQPVRDELVVTGFLLLEYPVGCWFCETPEATGVVNVELRADKSVDLKKGLVKVRGTFKLNRDDPEGYLFTLIDARVGEAD